MITDESKDDQSLPVSDESVEPVRIQSLSREAEASEVTAVYGVESERVTDRPSVPVQVVSSSSDGVAAAYQTSVQAVTPATKGGYLVKLFEAWKKIGGGSLMVSLLIHAGFIIAAYFIVQTIVHEQKVDFLPGGGSKSGNEASRELQHQVQTKKRNSFSQRVPIRRIAVESTSSAIQLPDLDVDDMALPEMSSSLLGSGSMGGAGFSTAGIGGGSGTGMGLGNLKAITFFGFSTEANRIAFLVDYSGSMSGEFRLTMEAELERSLKALPRGTEVLIIAWAGGAWLYDQKASEIKDKWEKLGNEYDNFAIRKGKKLKKPEWVPINADNIKKLMKGVKAQEQWPGGTDWRSPFLYALEANPQPDSIFFLTDGQIQTPKRALDAIDEAMLKLKRTPKVYGLWIVNKNYKPNVMKDLIKRYKGELREVTAESSTDAKKKR